MSEMEWMLFTAQLPATPSSLRVNVWRRLREAGAASLQNGVWVLPCSEENTMFMKRLLGYIRQNGASGQIFLVQELDQAVHEDILARFKADRDQEYEEFLEQCEVFMAEIQKETLSNKFTFAELEENEQNLQRLRKWITRIQKRDFFKTPKSQEAISALKNCRESFQSFTQRVYLQERIDILPAGDVPPKEAFPSDQGTKHDRQ